MTAPVSFDQLGLADSLLRAVAASGYTAPTPIQAQAIPHVLAGKDLLAAAQTGTGKTAGFTLPILQLLSSSAPAARRAGRPRVLVLTPTRELAAQVEACVQEYGRFQNVSSMVMFGGVGLQPQVDRLRQPLDILVATPGRLLDHAGQRTVDLSGVEILVLDEADRMLDMGFIHDIKKVLALLPKQRQNLLFSATFSDEIRSLATGLLRNPVSVDVAPRNSTSTLVHQTVHEVERVRKAEVLSHLVRSQDWQQVLVFTRTKHGANRLAERLLKDGIEAAAIHGNKSQTARTKALEGFKQRTVRVLVATDIAARGLDIEQLPQVVNYELPNVPEDYVHRIGRTGRAGSPGAAVSLVDHEELPYLAAIERLLRTKLTRKQVEGFVAAGPPRPENLERPPLPPRGGRGAPRPPQRAAGHAGNMPRSAPPARASAPRADGPAPEGVIRSPRREDSGAWGQGSGRGGSSGRGGGWGGRGR